MTKVYAEETPSFALKFSLQSNMAFLVAAFILACSLAWALRDHRRRLLELATEEQEDRFYITILGSLFCISGMGSYYAFNRTRIDEETGEPTTTNVIVTELLKTLTDIRDKRAKEREKPVPFSPELAVRMPVPAKDLLEERLDEGARYPEEEYQATSYLGLVALTMFALWYFWPKRRQEIAPPRDYMDRPQNPDLVFAGKPSKGAKK